MDFSQLKRYLSSLSPLPEDDWLLLQENLTALRFDKDVHFHSQGERCKNIMFLTRGLARSYIIDSSGREYTCNFHFNDHASSVKNVFVTDYASVVRNEESKVYFESLSDIDVVSFPVDLAKALYESNASWARIGRIIAEEAYYTTQERAFSLLTLTASERYDQLKTSIPHTISLIPDLYIASYLGVTPQSLSRLKKTL